MYSTNSLTLFPVPDMTANGDTMGVMNNGADLADSSPRNDSDYEDLPPINSENDDFTDTAAIANSKQAHLLSN
jgi:hypothetical protein